MHKQLQKQQVNAVYKCRQRLIISKFFRQFSRFYCHKIKTQMVGNQPFPMSLTACRGVGGGGVVSTQATLLPEMVDLLNLFAYTKFCINVQKSKRVRSGLHGKKSTCCRIEYRVISVNANPNCFSSVHSKHYQRKSVIQHFLFKFSGFDQTRKTCFYFSYLKKQDPNGSYTN